MDWRSLVGQKGPTMLHNVPAPVVSVVTNTSPESTWKEAAASVQVWLLVGDRFAAREALNELAKLPRPTQEQEKRFQELKKHVEELEESSLRW